VTPFDISAIANVVNAAATIMILIAILTRKN